VEAEVLTKTLENLQRQQEGRADLRLPTVEGASCLIQTAKIG
jgi:hypothetical protein